MRRYRFLTFGIVALLLVGDTQPKSTVDLESGAGIISEPVDVRNVQAVITGVLNGDSRERSADANEDGRVDILDLQLILVEASETQRPVDEAPSQGIPEITVPTFPRLPLPSLCSMFLDALWEENQASQSLSSSRRPIPVPTRTERYLYVLMPNAPPPSA